MSSLALYHVDLCCWFDPCKFPLSENEYFLGFINMYSLDFCFISSGVVALSLDSVLYVANIVLKSSVFTPSTNFESKLKFLLFVDSSGSLLLLKLSRSSRKRSIDSSYLCLLFFKLHHSLVPVHSVCEALQQNFENLVRSVAFCFLLSHHKLQRCALQIALCSLWQMFQAFCSSYPKCLPMS